MPFKSKRQQRFMFSAESRGELPKGTAKKWAEHTPDIKSLPETAPHKKHAFVAGFKTAAAAGFWHDPKKLEYAGLGALAAFPASDIYKGIKNKDKGEAARGAAEVGGLGLLARAVQKGHI